MSHKRWLPLEANPDVINQFSDGLGLDTTKAVFNEVFSLDPDALSFVPRPVYAVLLLFPIDDASERYKREEEERIEKEGLFQPDGLYYMKQTIGNACGTVAILHAILNNMDALDIREETFLKNFYERSETMTPIERAELLENPKEGEPDIESAHRIAAIAGETRTPDLNEKVNLHFICLVEKDGRLFELDGRKKFPIPHGPTTPSTFFEDAIQIAQNFMTRTESIQFNIMALTKQS